MSFARFLDDFEQNKKDDVVLSYNLSRVVRSSSCCHVVGNLKIWLVGHSKWSSNWFERGTGRVILSFKLLVSNQLRFKKLELHWVLRSGKFAITLSYKEAL